MNHILLYSIILLASTLNLAVPPQNQIDLTLQGQPKAPVNTAPPQPRQDQYMDGDRLVWLRGRNFEGRVDWWLTIDAQNGSDWKKDGYSAITTRLWSRYQPTLRKWPDGRWEIAFLKPLNK
jgi:hypothetical protein